VDLHVQRSGQDEPDGGRDVGRLHLTDPPTCTLSDPDGRFEIPGGQREEYVLEAMATGYAPARHRGRPRADVRIVLHEGGVALSGVVVDVFGGPVDGAWVAVENTGESTLGAMARTDREGQFSLWVAEGSVSLGAGAPDYATTYATGLAPSSDVRIELAAESVVAGIVVDADDGAPLSGIRVSAELLPGPDKYANRMGVTFTGADGRFEIRGLQANYYQIDAAAERSWGRARQAVELGIGDRRDDIRVEMFEGAELTGRIVDAETGEPCAEGSVATIDDAQSISRGTCPQ
jgi:hypothetical protein